VDRILIDQLAAMTDELTGVLPVPGFGCGDRSFQLAAAWSRRRGYRLAAARIGLNIGCTTQLVPQPN